MNYELSYFVYSLIFLAIWMVIFFLRRDLRRRMFLISLAVAPAGPISELWYLRDYWQRPTITGYPISIEDAVFAFAVGGITFGLFKTLFNTTLTQNEPFPPRRWLAAVLAIGTVASLLIFTNWLRVNSIFPSSLSFIAFAILVWRLRPDLAKPSLVTGVLTLILFLVVYQIMNALFPGVLLRWCTGCNPSGIRILGVNFEEMLWDFSWGLVGGVAYEAVRGKVLQRRKNAGGNRGLSKYSSYNEFDMELNKDYLDYLNSRFGRFMASSPKDVLPIRLVRELAYRLSKTAKRQISIKWIILFLVLLSPAVNFLLYPSGNFCQGPTLLWVLYYSILNYCMFKFPQVAWSRLIRVSDKVDDMLETDEDREKLIQWMKQWLNLPFQLLLSLAGGTIGVIVVSIVEGFASGIIRLCFAGYLSVFITAALGIVMVYWLWRVPLFIKRLHQFPSLRVTRSSPVRTAGIRGLSRLLGFSAVLAAIGGVLFVIPILWISFFTLQSREVFLMIEVAGFLGSLGTVLFITVFPQYWLSAIVYREKYRVLDQLSTEIENDISRGVAGDSWLSLEAKINIYLAIDSTSTSTIEGGTIARYILAVFTTVVPFAIRWL